MAEPFSFLPQDKTTEPLRDLGETIKGIHQQKIAVLEGQKKQLEALFDIPLEGMVQQHQQEVIDDIQKLREEATNTYAQAGQKGEIPSMKEVTDLQRKKREISAKVNASKNLEILGKQAVNDAMMIKRTGKELDPWSVKALDDWFAKPGKILDTPDPRLLVQPAYDFDQMEKDFKSTLPSKMQETYQKDPKTGKYTTVSVLDPKGTVDNLWKYNQRYRQFWTTQAGGDPVAGRHAAEAHGENYAVQQTRYAGGNPSAYNFMQYSNYQHAHPKLERMGDSIPVSAQDISYPSSISMKDAEEDENKPGKYKEVQDNNHPVQAKLMRIFVDKSGKNMKIEESVTYTKPVKSFYGTYSTDANDKIIRQPVTEIVTKDFTPDFMAKLDKMGYDISDIKDMWEEVNSKNKSAASKASSGKIKIPGLKIK